VAAAALSPVRVTFVSSHAHGGGSERYLELLLGELGPDWVAGVVALQDGAFASRLRELGYDVDVIPTGARLGVLPAALRLRRAFREQRPAVVHANGVKAALVARLATAGTRTPVIWLKHDFSWDGPLARVLGAASTEVVAVAGAITTTFGPRTLRKTRVVPNGLPPITVDSDVGRGRVAELLGLDGATPVVTLVARQHPAKGIVELIEAAPAVLELEPRASFLIVGGEDPFHADYAALLRRRVTELGLEDTVVFAGQRSDPLELMAGSTVVAMPSVPDERGAGREACPFALLEAMAVGTPVVAYAAGGIPEVLGDCGVLVAEGDRDELAGAIARTLADAAERERLSACAAERVATRFRLATTVDAMRERYASLARG
jgi:glycosyltransferase involved in cell wall biosynthesis